ncbi:exodeoxyribonuclease V [Bifidobacterium longum]|uniref:exodeoxyribonuclease V n=1 Tax=Bifidobacterium longum TaxID=216816 RepID=UPI002023F7B0|nr:exodeoxyribonuclease V [Bifidobacterium longum]
MAAGTACVLAAVRARISGLITEIYTNISRYADKDVPYFLTIEEKNDEVIITQANGIANLTVDNSEDRGSGGSGNGLRMHAQWIDSIGGVPNTSKEYGEWILYASIPVSRE